MHITGSLTGIGGTPRKLLCLARHSDAGAIRHAFVSIEGGDLKAEYLSEGSDLEIVGSAAPFKVIGAALRFARCFEPDVVSTHFTRAFVCGAVVAKILKRPQIHNEHGPAVLGAKDPAIVAQLGRRLRRLWLPKASAILCNSAYTARTIQEVYGVDAALLRVIHNPVEPRADAAGWRDAHAGEERPFRMGHIGGMTDWRDQHTLVRAIRVLRDAGTHAELILVGDGPMRASLQALAEELGLGDSIAFWGYRQDLRDFFATIDVYVNPAIAEGFGIAVAEAMLAGIPVVAADAGAHPELIEDGQTGFLYTPRDVRDLAARLRVLASDASERSRLGGAAQFHARHAFSPQRYVEAYRRIVEDVLEDSSGATELGQTN
jgi:glycosyltransferase involved in cell wall biosynthesis